MQLNYLQCMLRFHARSGSTKSQRFSVNCPVVVTVVVTLHKLDIWVKGHKLLSLLSV